MVCLIMIEKIMRGRPSFCGKSEKRKKQCTKSEEHALHNIGFFLFAGFSRFSTEAYVPRKHYWC